MRMNFLKEEAISVKKFLFCEKGSMIWYLFWAIAGIAVFYLIFFFLWGSIKGWFVTGS